MWHRLRFGALLRRTPVFNTRTLSLGCLLLVWKPVTAAGCLRLRFVLLRISDTGSANQSWPAPAPMFVALKTTGRARQEPSVIVVGGGRLMAHEKFKDCSLLGAAHRLCLRACISAAAAAAARIAGHKSPLTPPTRLHQRSTRERWLPRRISTMSSASVPINGN